MKANEFVTMCALMCLPLWAQAHAHLVKSTPAANSSGAAPTQFMLEFNEPAQLTALTVQREGDKTPHRWESLPDKPQKAIHLNAPQLTPGAYLLMWRALSDDKHVMSGQLRFTVTAQ